MSEDPRAEQADTPPHDIPVFYHKTHLNKPLFEEPPEGFDPSCMSAEAKVLLDRMKTPVKTVVAGHDGIHQYEMYSPSFFNIWEEQPEMVVHEGKIIAMTSLLYGELKYHTEWLYKFNFPLPSETTCVDRAELHRFKNFPFTGLNALKNLFGEEVSRGCFQTKPPQSYPSYAQPPPGSFKPGTKFANFEQWQQGFCVALQRFGETDLADSNASGLLGLHVKDVQFLTRWAKARGREARPVLQQYRRFAQLWDKYHLPLRFWNKTTAWHMMRRMYGLSCEYAEFARSFYSQKLGEKSKRAPGLVGLTPHTPEVITRWRDSKTPELTIDASAAELSGFSVKICKQVLENCLGVKMHVR